MEEASEGVGRGRSPVLVLVGLMGVGVLGRRRLVTSLSGAAAFHCRLNLGLESGTGAGKPCGVAVLVVMVVGCLIGIDSDGGE